MTVPLRRRSTAKNNQAYPRVAVVDDHAFMRDLIARALRRAASRYEVVATVGTAAEAVSACRRLAPNLVVLDINLPDRNGVAIVPDIRRVSPNSRILLCTAFPCADWITEASTSGADGFVEKTNSWAEFIDAVDRVSRGQRYFCSAGPAAARETRVSTAARVSPRERQILIMIAGGLTTKEIATQLFISVPTVETHRAHLMTKTGVRNVAGLVRFAMRAGFISS